MQKFDSIGDVVEHRPHSRFFGSARMTYCICACLAMIAHLFLRNTINVAILYMVSQPTIAPAEDIVNRIGIHQTERTVFDNKMGTVLNWTRRQEFIIQSTFYYGYVVTLSVAGRLADCYGGKYFLVGSIIAESLAVILTPVLARYSFNLAAMIRVFQGLCAGFGAPSIYQLFSVWSPKNERTAALSFAYGGFSIGSLIVFPVASLITKYNVWDTAFYIIGSVCLVFGIACNFLIFNTLESHPRLSRAEYQYLKSQQDGEERSKAIPWKLLLKSVPVYAFIATHLCHSYGIIVLSIMTPRFLKEAMSFSLEDAGLYSSVPFLGAFISKTVTIASCTFIEKRENIDLTIFRKIIYVSCNCITIALITGIIFFDCRHPVHVLLLFLFVGMFTDIGFSGAYWPSLLYVAPAYSGLISGIANSFATLTGILAPLGISVVSHTGKKSEWNLVLISMIIAYALGAIVFGLFGSSKLQPWGHGIREKSEIDRAAKK